MGEQLLLVRNILYLYPGWLVLVSMTVSWSMECILGKKENSFLRVGQVKF